jgi:hypothetical protein
MAVGVVLVVVLVLAWRWDVTVRLYRSGQGSGERAAVARELSRQIDNGRAGGQGFIP